MLAERNLELIARNQEIGRLAREARSIVSERQSDIREYLIVGKELVLAPAFNDRALLDFKLDSLVMLSEGKTQEDRAEDVRTAVNRWERGWAMPNLRPDAAGRQITEREILAGNELYESIRGAFQSFQAGHQRIYHTELTSLERTRTLGIALMVTEVLLLLAALAWLVSLAKKQAMHVSEMQQDLDARTAELSQQGAELDAQTVKLERITGEATNAVASMTEMQRATAETTARLEAAESAASCARIKHIETQSLLDFILDNAPVGVVLYGADLAIVRVNSAMEKITGMSAAAHVGKRPDDFVSDDIAEVIEDALQKVFSTRAAILEVPHTGVSRNEPTKERNFLSSYFPVTLPGNVPGAASLVLETTQYRQLEEQLLQSQKMEAVGRLAGGVAHDFNNMLTAIMSYGELILADMGLDSPQRADMLEIVKASEKAAILTRKLLAFSRQQVLRPSRVHLNETITGLEKMIRRILGSDVELSLDFAPELWSVSADPTEVERIMMNLVINSRDAMPDGGSLTIATSNVSIDDAYADSHADTSPGDYVLVSVTDTGMGMSREVREKLFEPFFTTKEKGKGTGLGLPSVYGIVKQSGGFLWVYSEPGKGTTFKIYLPRGETESRDASKTPSKNRRVGAETILLVEDDAEVRNVATRILRRNGYRVLEAENGVQALRICEEEDEMVDLIVTDIVMPEMGGSELASRIRETRPDARILFTSGYTEDAVIRQSLVDPGEAFIEKPFTPASLAKKAREALEYTSDPDAP